MVGNQGSSTHLMELLSAERDAKRRRAAHRGKKIHTNKKSYTEVRYHDNIIMHFGINTFFDYVQFILLLHPCSDFQRGN